MVTEAASRNTWHTNSLHHVLYLICNDRSEKSWKKVKVTWRKPVVAVFPLLNSLISVQNEERRQRNEVTSEDQRNSEGVRQWSLGSVDLGPDMHILPFLGLKWQCAILSCMTSSVYGLRGYNELSPLNTARAYTKKINMPCLMIDWVYVTHISYGRQS